MRVNGKKYVGNIAWKISGNLYELRLKFWKKKNTLNIERLL